jgi:hypothetical protein
MLWYTNILDIDNLTYSNCPNEDVDSDGQLDAGEDVNNNGTLEPGTPVSVTPSATTDSTGTATIRVTYPRDRARWVTVRLTLRGTVAGTEATYNTTFTLPGLASDYTSQTVNPPGNPSPYGVGDCTTAN